MWSIPIIISGEHFPFDFRAKLVIVEILVLNCVMSVFGGLYILPIIIFFPLLLKISIKTDSVSPSQNMSKSCLLL